MARFVGDESRATVRMMSAELETDEQRFPQDGTVPLVGPFDLLHGVNGPAHGPREDEGDHEPHGQDLDALGGEFGPLANL
jgi:hypothetical protein